MIERDGIWTGSFGIDDEAYIVQLKDKLFSGSAADETVIYRVSDVGTDFMDYGWGLDDELIPPPEAIEALPSVILPATGTLRELRIDIIADFEYWTEYKDNTTSQINDLFHQIDAIYQRDLGIKLTVDELLIYTNSDNPFNGLTDAYDVLYRLRDLNHARVLPFNSFGLTHLKSGKNFDGSVIGLAYVNTVCGDVRYATGISQNYRSFTTSDLLVTAHEIGHNLGASHDTDADGRFIMWPTASSTVTMEFSAKSVAAIEPNKSKSCFSNYVGEDTTPDPFELPAQTDVPVYTLVQAQTVVVSGINAPTQMSITYPGKYSINGRLETSEPRTVNAGDKIYVLLKSGGASETRSTTLTIGGLSAEFKVTSEKPDTRPDPFSFPSVTDANPGQRYDRSSSQLSGFNTDTPISITGGEYCLGTTSTCTQYPEKWTDQPGTVKWATGWVLIRNRASTEYGKSTVATLNIGGVTADFIITTKDTPQFTATVRTPENGTVTPASQKVKEGERAVFNVAPNANYTINGVTGCDGTLSGNTYTTAPMTKDCTITAYFKQSTYIVSASSGQGGSIDPSSRSVTHGQTASFTLQPDNGYQIDEVAGCNGSLSGTTYTTGQITANCQVTATFKLIPETCNQVTATLEEHYEAGRVWSEYTGRCWGTFCYGGQWNIYTVGSDILISHNGQEIHTLHEMSGQPNVWWPGSCPNPDPLPPSIDSVSNPVVKKIGEEGDNVVFELTVSGKASDPNNNLAKIEFGAAANTTVCQGTNEFSCSIQVRWAKADLPVTVENAFGVIATDQSGLTAMHIFPEVKLENTIQPTCHTSSNLVHSQEGRAYQKWNVLFYANGSNTYLGLNNNITSLQESSPGVWNKVNGCN
jgi:hypothetical protein